MADPLSADNPLAERRFAYAEAAARDGDFAAAADVLEQAIEIAPGWAAAWFALAEARRGLGDVTAARRAFAETLRLDPDDRQGAGPRLAALEGRFADSLPRAFVARLFDDYAPRFDAHLTQSLGYRGPEILRAAVERAAPGRRFRRVVDLGCGSGLSGAEFRPLAEQLIGVDLSPRMIEAARRRGLYDRLAVGDVVEFLSAEPEGAADLAVAADVFVYLGDLASALGAITRALGGDGLLAFTVEAEAGDGYRLADNLRFRHTRAYVESAVAEAGLKLLAIESVSTRSEAGAEVPGLAAVARRGR